MKNVLRTTPKELNEYAISKVGNLDQHIIGTGSEGTTYLMKDGKTIKLFDIVMAEYILGYKLYNSSILMKQDLNLESFYFPYVIYVDKENRIIGYESDYFPNNIFNGFETTAKIDLDKLIEARENMIKDIKVLTTKGYKLFELPRNLLFDGKKLGAIDTLDYKVQRDITLRDNINTLDYAIDAELKLHNNGSDEKYNKILEYKKRNKY